MPERSKTPDPREEAPDDRPDTCPVHSTDCNPAVCVAGNLHSCRTVQHDRSSDRYRVSGDGADDVGNGEYGMKKYELTAESIVKFGRTLFRIKALVAFGNVEEGELGGFVEQEGNLDQSGNAWVGGNAVVRENAWVGENAWVSGNAVVGGDAWVSGDAVVSGNAVVRENAVVGGKAVVRENAWVSGDAWVGGNAEIFKTSHFLVVGPIGSRNDFTTFFRTKYLTIGVKCGCFKGDIDQFFEAVEKTHGNNKHARAYKAAIALAKLQIDLSKEDPDEEETGKES